MSASAVRPLPLPGAIRAARSPALLGAVRAEVLKISRQRLTWAMLGVAFVFFAVVALGLSGVPATGVKRSAHTFFHDQLDIWSTIFQVGSGIFLLIAVARLMGMEFSAGTVRVLLGRGQSRLQLYAAKLIAVVALGVLLLAGFSILAGGFVALRTIGAAGSLQPLQGLPGSDWRDLAISLAVMLVSILATTLVGLAAAILGRSLAFALGFALAFFPADNAATLILTLLQTLTHRGFFGQVTAYLLGPNLNAMRVALLPAHQGRAAFAVPAVPVDGLHTLVVTAAWVAILLVVPLAMLVRRDVLE
ncbi:MAG: ABC transporter permease [Candidatus Dormibacteraeota bacterium]|nr:ABC transporter permease [Candidatus Dormibacteraeota bacterium]